MVQVASMRRRGEHGVVSLLTVIFFMVFISLIVMGFITIVVADQRQTTDNDLSASALAAARSGIEDGKRILLYCQAHPADARCASALNSQNNCNAFNSGQAYDLAKNTLAIPIDSTGEGATGGATDYEQYFTCLTIQRNTPSLSAPLSSDSDYIQRIKTTSQFTQLKISWAGEGSYMNRSGAIAGWPTLSSWNSSGYMPVIRFQTIPYNDVTDLDGNEARSRTIFIVPCGGGGCPSTSSDINVLDARTDSTSTSGGQHLVSGQNPVKYATCTTLGVSYECTATLSGYDSGVWQYYIRASVLYAGTTTMTLSALSSTGAAVDFDNVQPWIDVTGRTSDVFKRVRAEVSYQPTVALPTNALDSAAPICKKLTVTDSANSSSYDCN